jgi:hypothetical protein
MPRVVAGLLRQHHSQHNLMLLLLQSSGSSGGNPPPGRSSPPTLLAPHHQHQGHHEGSGCLGGREFFKAFTPTTTPSEHRQQASLPGDGGQAVARLAARGPRALLPAALLHRHAPQPPPPPQH